MIVLVYDRVTEVSNEYPWNTWEPMVVIVDDSITEINVEQP